MKKQSFKQKVQSMKPSEIVMSMVNGLEKKWVKINMNSFGNIANNVCFGCAATNTICEIIQKQIPSDSILNRISRVEFLFNHNISFEYVLEEDEDFQFLFHFEYGIDSLRRGDLDSSFHYLFRTFFKRIPEHLMRHKLPVLLDTFTKDDLNKYKEFANLLKENGY